VLVHQLSNSHESLSEVVASETVSAIIPCYNEEAFILKALDGLAEQYDSDRYEIVVVDGMSTDRTRDLVTQFAKSHPELRVRLVDNPERIIPRALNLGVQHATGRVIARMDAHAAPSRGYIRQCVQVLNQENVGVVGMPCLVQPGANTRTARAIAGAVSHQFGIGDAKYRLCEGDLRQESVDTVAFACFRKELWTQLGGFNESLLANEDYDFNYRVRKAGQEVILDRSGHSEYFARPTIAGLARQYLRYGRWKAQMLKLNPQSLKMRHLVAPLFVISIAVFGALAFVWEIARFVLAGELLLYLVTALIFGYQIAHKNRGGLQMTLLLPVVFLTIHLSWGTSFLLGILLARAAR
jgi:succinoglycan biosynthesis protein ExoA